jgi:hypothetical protein
MTAANCRLPHLAVDRDVASARCSHLIDCVGPEFTAPSNKI